MNNALIIKNLSRDVGINRSLAAIVLKAMKKVIRDSLIAGEEVYLPNFGLFKTISSKSRNYQSIGTVLVPEKRRLKFIPSMNLKRFIKNLPK